MHVSSHSEAMVFFRFLQIPQILALCLLYFGLRVMWAKCRQVQSPPYGHSYNGISHWRVRSLHACVAGHAACYMSRLASCMSCIILSSLIAVRISWPCMYITPTTRCSLKSSMPAFLGSCTTYSCRCTVSFVGCNVSSFSGSGP